MKKPNNNVTEEDLTLLNSCQTNVDRTQAPPDMAQLEKYLNMNLDEVDFSNRVKNFLAYLYENTKPRGGHTLATVRDLCGRTERDLLRYRNIGHKSVKEIKDKLAEMGLKLLDTYFTGHRYEELIGYVCVDAGMLMVCDPCYIEGEWNSRPVRDDVQGGDFNIAGAAKSTMNPQGHGPLRFRMGHRGAGVAFSTGGDGSFPVTVKRSAVDDSIMKVTIHLTRP